MQRSSYTVDARVVLVGLAVAAVAVLLVAVGFVIGRGGHSVPRRPAAVAVNPVSTCRTQIDDLPPGPPTRLYDVQHLLRQRLVAPLPVNKPGYATPSEEAGPYHFNTADQYLQAHAVADPDLWA